MIVMVSGRAGEGKTTFAMYCQDILVADHNSSSAIVPFARMVKETAFFMGWDGEKDDKGRKLLQEIGNTGREYDIDIWARHAVEFIKQHPAEFEYVFIDDWRFPNEGKYLQEHFWPTITVRVQRPKEYHTLLNSPLYNDISEISLPESEEYYNVIIKNDGTSQTLEEKARKFVKENLIERK
jgi:dephospho-CoA kinase